jgi:Zn-dependent M28 family amino/carboxypeptidase
MRTFFMAHTKLLILSVLLMAGCSREQPASFDSQAAVETLKTLSADDMQGRATGTEGSAKARAYLLAKIANYGFEPVASGYEQAFIFQRENKAGETKEYAGVNLSFQIKGTGQTGKKIIVSAHYDHLGVVDGKIYNGADDNASGVAGVFAVAESFHKQPPLNDFVFVLFDAEETGLGGARAYGVANEVAPENIALNINFDMISRSDKNELYVAGGFHQLTLMPLINDMITQASVELIAGHDDPALGPNDWTLQSDHAIFHRANIPFLYFGVEDHVHYHQPSDDFETVPLDFFIRSLQTVVRASYLADQWAAKAE